MVNPLSLFYFLITGPETRGCGCHFATLECIFAATEGLEPSYPGLHAGAKPLSYVADCLCLSEVTIPLAEWLPFYRRDCFTTAIAQAICKSSIIIGVHCFVLLFYFSFRCRCYRSVFLYSINHSCVCWCFCNGFVWSTCCLGECQYCSYSRQKQYDNKSLQFHFYF